MRCRRIAALLVLALAGSACAGGDDQSGEQRTEGAPPMPPDMLDMTPQVVLDTNVGRIVLELDREKAPETVESIIEHVEAGFYDGLTFHRVIPGFMIQGGGFTADMRPRQSSREALPNEADNGLKNVRGSVAMARTAEPHSATTQFFINLAGNPNLDHRDKTPRGWGYTVFGHVLEGMDVVDSIAGVETHKVGPHDDVPIEPVVIQSAHLAEEDGE